MISKLRQRLAITFEELVNVATHGIGLVVSIALLPVFVYLASRVGDIGVVIGVTIFSITLIGCYAASTVYHALKPGPRRDLWRRLDQAAVYLLIAGTYTPFALGALRGPWGWGLLAVSWIVAIVGVAVKVKLRIDKAAVETVTYLAMGWMIIVIIQPLLASIGWAGLAWIFAGGAAYTIGVIFLVNQRRFRFGHCVWHVAVLGGSACHCIAVVNYGMMLPR